MFPSLESTVGNTPLVRLQRLPGERARSPQSDALQTLQQLMERVEHLERHVDGHLSRPHPEGFVSGIWHDDDFVI